MDEAKPLFGTPFTNINDLGIRTVHGRIKCVSGAAAIPDFESIRCLADANRTSLNMDLGIDAGCFLLISDPKHLTRHLAQIHREKAQETFALATNQ